MSHSITITWTPAENDITEIRSYSIMRSVDGGAFALLLKAKVLRDFIGGIIGVEGCTTETVPTDATIQAFRDAPVTYVDATVAVGHTYCYYVFGTPLGNNQSVAQGPPSAPSNIFCLAVQAIATAVVLSGSIVNNDEVDLTWTASTVEGSTIANYLVFRNQDGGAFSQLTEVDGSTLAFNDTTVVLGPVYGYYVVAIPVQGLSSPPSNVVFEQLSVFFTSQIYPVQVIESMLSAGLSEPVPTYQFAEGVVSAALLESGTLVSSLLTYTNWPHEGLVSAALLESGTLVFALLPYTNGLPEGIVSGAQFESGTLTIGLVGYTNWPAEGLKSTASLTSGTLT